MAEYAAVDLTGEAEGSGCPHEAVEMLIKNTGVAVGEISPVVGSRITPFAEVYFSIAEVNE